jgi:hypothetical protein
MSWISMRKRLTALFLIVIFSLPGCRLPVNQGTLIGDIIYPQSVPVSFEALVICKVKGSEKDVGYAWSCDNGTIIGSGSKVIWVAPAAAGLYDVKIKLTDKSGNEEERSVSIDVVSFSKKDIDIGADIGLKFPSTGNKVVCEQFCTYPTNTLEISLLNLHNIDGLYSYNWSSNGGKMMGAGIKEGTAEKVGWTAPGMAGNYTVRVTATDVAGNISVGQVYVCVKAPHCCEVAPLSPSSE